MHAYKQDNSKIYILKLIVIILFCKGVINNSLFNLFDLSFNLFCPAIFIYQACVTNKKYQGTPYKSKKSERDIKILTTMQVYLTIGRITQALENIYIIFKAQFAYNILTNQDCDSWCYIEIFGYTVNYTVFWIIPLWFTLTSRVQKILSKQFKQNKLLNLDYGQDNEIETVKRQENQLELKQENQQENEEQKKEKRFSITDFTDKSILELQTQEIIFEQAVKSEGRCSIKFGELNLCKIGREKYVGKQFRMSQYLIDEINQNAQSYRKLSNPHLQPIKAIAVDQDSIYFLTPYFQHGNIAEYIYGKKQTDSSMQKQYIDYIKEIAEAMNYLHNQSPPLYHMNLSSTNCMITKTNQIRIMDFGLGALKKYYALTSGYTTKSQFSPPEQLKERSPTPAGTQEGDVYAFGILVWEIYHQQQAFSTSSTTELKKLILEEQKRPKINENIPEDIKQLIRSCWQQDKDQRPNFEKIIKFLHTGEKII